jgi:hypothetical protein
MKPASTAAREEIAAALQNANLPAYPSVLGTTPLPAVIMQPGSPYLEKSTIAKDVWTVNFLISVQVQAFDTNASLGMIEALIEQTLEALPDGCIVSDVSAPSLDSLGEGQGSIYAAQIALSVLSKKEK